MIIPGSSGAESELVCHKQYSGAGNAVFLIVLAFVLFSCATRHHKPFTVAPPEQRNLSTYENRLQKAVAASTHLTMERIGQVDYPGFQAD